MFSIVDQNTIEIQYIVISIVINYRFFAGQLTFAKWSHLPFNSIKDTATRSILCDK